MVKIKLIELGDNYPFEVSKVESFGENSSIFKIIEKSNDVNPFILVNNPILIPDDAFRKLDIQKGNTDFVVLIVKRPLENNFFSRLINDHAIVVSLYGFESLDMRDGISNEMIVTRFILGFSAIFSCFNRFPAYNEVKNLMQINTTGCLFDMCIIKSDVVKFFRNPHISEPALAFLNKHAITQGFLSSLQKEILNLRIPTYYRIREWLKKQPFITPILSFLFSFIFLGLLVSLVWDLIKCIFHLFTNC